MDTHAPETSHERAASRTFRACAGMGTNGLPCRQAALSGSAFCRWHDAKHKRQKREERDATRITESSLRELVSVDLTKDENLQLVRSTLFAWLLRGEIDPVRARQAEEFAAAIHESSHKRDGDEGFSTLARSIAEGMSPPKHAP